MTFRTPLRDLLNIEHPILDTFRARLGLAASGEPPTPPPDLIPPRCPGRRRRRSGRRLDDPGPRRALLPALLVALALTGLPACAPMPRVETALPPESKTAITREQAVEALAAARTLITKRDYPRARGTVTQALSEAERWGWSDVASDAHFLLGEMFDREQKPREAADAYARAYDESRRLGDRGRGVRTLNALTNALLDGGADAKAREAAGEAYRLALGENDLGAQATAQNNLGEAHRLAGRPDLAREGYERALDLARRAADRAAVASILINLGIAERRTGRPVEARTRFAEARDLALGLDDQRASAYAQWNLDQIDAEIQRAGGNR